MHRAVALAGHEQFIAAERHVHRLAPDLDLTTPWQGKDTAYKMAFSEKPEIPPGAGFIYSDINFITL